MPAGKNGKKVNPKAKRKTNKKKKPVLQGISKGDIRRLAKRGGVKRVAFNIYQQSRFALQDYLEGVIREVLVFTTNAKRKTIHTMDVLHALKRRGQPMYGFEA